VLVAAKVSSEWSAQELPRNFFVLGGFELQRKISPMYKFVNIFMCKAFLLLHGHGRMM